jgi:hypothetical protein
MAVQLGLRRALELVALLVVQTVLLKVVLMGSRKVVRLAARLVVENLQTVALVSKPSQRFWACDGQKMERLLL